MILGVAKKGTFLVFEGIGRWRGEEHTKKAHSVRDDNNDWRKETIPRHRLDFGQIL